MVTEEPNFSPQEMAEVFKEGMKVIRLATIGRITSIIVHEINNPMQAIQGGAALGLEELDDPQAAKLYFELIRRESGRVLRLTEILRSVYHPENTSPDVIDLKPVIDEILLFIKDDLNQKGIVLVLSCPESMAPVLGSRPQLYVALLNIFLNINSVIALAGHRDLALAVSENGGMIALDFSTGLPIEIDPKAATLKNFVDLSIAQKVIHSFKGTIVLNTTRAASVLQVKIPNREAD